MVLCGWTDLSAHQISILLRMYGLFKDTDIYRRSVWERQRAFRNEQELTTLAREVWEILPWDRIYMYIDRRDGEGLRTHW
jgi:hypothetical protein